MQNDASTRTARDAGEERGGAKTATLMDTLSRDAKECRTSGYAGVNLGTWCCLSEG